MTDKQTVKFSDIAAQILNRVTPKEGEEKNFIGLEHLISGCLYINKWGDDKKLSTQAFKVNKGDIIFARRNTYLKRVAISPIDGICSADAMVIRPVAGLIEPAFLPFFMQSNVFMERAISISAGSLSSRVKWKDLAQQSFVLPTLEEQRKLLKSLNKLDEIIELKKGIQCSVLDLKRIFISKFFSKKYLEDYGAKKVSFLDSLEIVSGQVDPTSEKYKKYPHIAPDNMEKKLAILLPYNTAEQDKVKSGKFLFDEEHVLYSKIRPNLRKVVFPRIKGVCSADVYPLKGKCGLQTEYLFYLLQSEHFNKYAIGTSMRTGMPKINRQDLCAYSFYLPSKELQCLIVKRLKALDGQYLEITKALTSAYNLKNAYLNMVR
ncbi:hypothetical protein GNP63_01950 [Aliivibrio fischeri]|uniref:restriction endonuclease subunit S n=1 Tax=Aliivibrio fischeri TaxID=668 RepID=UPI0012D8DA74|nr:restriction endonuclease subunit S [Aliivibrio fischeri]MUH95316.1 hypothetical protein [Aliivibrio fischeri]MUI65544.1 hypothetical protein [Aliivibrio fischeri]